MKIIWYIAFWGLLTFVFDFLIGGFISYWMAEHVFTYIDFSAEISIRVWHVAGIVCVLIVLAPVAYKIYDRVKSSTKEKRDSKEILQQHTDQMKRSYVIGTQLYYYQFSPSKGEVFIQHVHGAYASRENIKSIVQHVYTIDRSVLTSLERAVELAKNNDDYKRLLTLYRKVLECLNDAQSADNMGKAVNYYSVLMLIGEYISQLKHPNIEDNKFFDPWYPYGLVEREVVENENNGLFRAVINSEILWDDQYVFWNYGSTSKRGRMYIAFKIKQHPYMVLVTLSEAVTTMDENQMDEYIQDVMTSYQELVEQEGENLIR